MCYLRRPLVAVSALAALVLLIAGAVVLVNRRREGPADGLRSRAETPSASAAARKVERDASGRIVRLPDYLGALEKVLPPELAGARESLDMLNDPSKDVYYSWHVFNTRMARALLVHTWLFETDKGAQKDFSGRLRSLVEGDHSTSRVKVYASDFGPAKNITGVGDRAFGAPVRQYRVPSAGPSEDSRFTYDIGGCQVVVRYRNVVLWFRWTGADYSGADGSGGVMRGSDFTYESARDQALGFARSILSELR